MFSNSTEMVMSFLSEKEFYTIKKQTRQSKYNFLIKIITKDGKISSERPITSLIDQFLT